MDGVAVAIRLLLLFSLSHHSPLIIIILILILIISFICSFHMWYITNHLFVEIPLTISSLLQLFVFVIVIVRILLIAFSVFLFENCVVLATMRAHRVR